MTRSQHGWLEEADDTTSIIDPTPVQAILVDLLPIQVIFCPAVNPCRLGVEQALRQVDELPLMFAEVQEAALTSSQVAYRACGVVSLMSCAWGPQGLAGSASAAAQAMTPEQPNSKEQEQ